MLDCTLSDYGDGTCLWIGTPRGENQFKEIYDHAIKRMEKADGEWYAMRFPASETKVLAQEELDAAKATMDESQYLQEFEVSWSAALIGAYYASQLDSADLAGRIGSCPWEPNLEVFTSWDLGRKCRAKRLFALLIIMKVLVKGFTTI